MHYWLYWHYWPDWSTLVIILLYFTYGYCHLHVPVKGYICITTSKQTSYKLQTEHCMTLSVLWFCVPTIIYSCGILLLVQAHPSIYTSVTSKHSSISWKNCSIWPYYLVCHIKAGLVCIICSTKQISQWYFSITAMQLRQPNELVETTQSCLQWY